MVSFLHLVDSEHRLISQHGSYPQNGSRPTPSGTLENGSLMSTRLLFQKTLRLVYTASSLFCTTLRRVNAWLCIGHAGEDAARPYSPRNHQCPWLGGRPRCIS